MIDLNPLGMRREPPTADEVRAVAKLWCERSEVIGDAVTLLIEDVAPHCIGAVPSILYLMSGENGAVLAAHAGGDPDGSQTLDEVTANARGTLWMMVSPDGPLPWARVAELVAQNADTTTEGR